MNHSYRKLVQTRLTIMIITAILSFVAVAIAYMLRMYIFTDSESSISNITGVLSFFVAFEVVIVFRMIRYSRILKDDAKLEKMEIEEFDERGRHIRQSASRMCIWLFIIILGVATIIAYFFSKTVCLTLGVTLVVLLVLYSVLKVIYSKMIL